MEFKTNEPTEKLSTSYSGLEVRDTYVFECSIDLV